MAGLPRIIATVAGGRSMGAFFTGSFINLFKFSVRLATKPARRERSLCLTVFRLTDSP